MTLGRRQIICFASSFVGSFSPRLIERQESGKLVSFYREWHSPRKVRTSHNIRVIWDTAPPQIHCSQCRTIPYSLINSKDLPPFARIMSRHVSYQFAGALWKSCAEFREMNARALIMHETWKFSLKPVNGVCKVFSLYSVTRSSACVIFPTQPTMSYHIRFRSLQMLSGKVWLRL